MRLFPTTFRSGRAWWAVFGLLIATPALALSWLGLRVVRAQRIELEQQFREQQTQFARLADAGIGNVLAELEAELRRADTLVEAGETRFDGGLADLPTMSFRRSGLLTFPRDKVYFGEFGQRPAERPSSARWSAATQRLVEQAQAAEAQGRSAAAVNRYRGIAQGEAGLRAWAEISIARLQHQGGDATALKRLASSEWSQSDGITPTGLPAAFLACAYVQRAPAEDLRAFISLLQQTLDNLRAGAWWLSAEERRFHDRELQRLLRHVGSPPAVPADARFGELEAIEHLVHRSPPSRRDAVTRAFERGTRGAFLFVWSPRATDPERWSGVALSQPRLADVLEPVLTSLLSGQPFVAAIRDAEDDPLWSQRSDMADGWHVEELRTVPGWKLAFSGPTGVTGLDQRQWLWYGFIVVLLVVLLTGLAMTAHIVRHELELGRRQSDFVAAVSHEFKSPITSIRVLMERLASGRLRTSEGTSEYYVAIERETDRLERLVNRLLESQQIESGQKEYTLVPSSLVDLATQAVHHLQPQAEAKGIQVETKLDRDLPAVRVDRAAIADALENLIDNAVKYSPPGSQVTVQIQQADHGVRVDVTDQGIGIDPDDLPQIFDKFYRARRGDRHDVRGTGLGLALVKATAEAHGGTVDVSSVPGEGSRFSLRLPLGPAPGDS